MKYEKLISAMTLLVALSIPVSLAAQQHPTKHRKYNLVDIGTLGGPNVFFNFSGYPNSLLGNNGTVTGGVDTSIVDPLCFNNPDCFVEHAFKWREAELNDLGALPGGTGNNDSQAFWMNDRGQTVGVSTNGAVDPLLNYPFYRAVLWSDQGKIEDLGTLEDNMASRRRSIAEDKWSEWQRMQFPIRTTFSTTSSGASQGERKTGHFCGIRKQECRTWARCQVVMMPSLNM